VLEDIHMSIAPNYIIQIYKKKMTPFTMQKNVSLTIKESYNIIQKTRAKL